MKTIVTFSGGKDSLAALLYVRNNLTKNFITVFCDTGWEHPLTYQYIREIEKKLQLDLRVLKSKKYDSMVDMSRKKKRFPSAGRRFCTMELKVYPSIDFILDEIKDNFLLIEGIRGLESASRAKMQIQCTYFKYYFEPYGYDNKGKPKFKTYRKKEVKKYCEKYVADILRPVFDWTGQQVIDYIVKNGLEPNPLYKMGFKRVGCFPCIMETMPQISQITQRYPERINEIAEYEKEIGSSFFGPDKISKKYFKGEYPLIEDVAKYVHLVHSQGILFDDFTPTSCMSYYGLCE